MASTNNPQEFLNSLELGEVSDFVSDLFTLYSYLDLVNDDHFKSLSIEMEQLVIMKNAREEQHPDVDSDMPLHMIADYLQDGVCAELKIHIKRCMETLDDDPSPA
ncbi:unnamed protein product [Adineta steineri]|uniref:Uncharacterized protein n=1 Tax=Adineta steineri TaxID=433720 RepID=A0A814VYZ1_9BILA|nr:unnamed protein product [Adineta steineri]CAF4107595.1 unnamed protein product [Adineta steineri]